MYRISIAHTIINTYKGNTFFDTFTFLPPPIFADSYFFLYLLNSIKVRHGTERGTIEQREKQETNPFVWT